MSEPIPLEDLAVNDRYWLGRARELLTGSLTLRQQAAATLTTAIGWFWTVYTAAALVGVAIADARIPVGPAIVLAAPAVLLLLAYLVATWAAMPVDVDFDARDPLEVRAAHIRAVTSTRSRLWHATWLTGAAALAVAAAVLVAATRQPLAPSSFAARLERSTPRAIVVGGRFDPNQEVRFVARPMPTGRPAELLRMAGEKGDIDGRLTGMAAADTYAVTAEWIKDKVSRTITRTVREGD